MTALISSELPFGPKFLSSDGASKIELITSPNVTLVVIDWAMDCKSMVLPVARRRDEETALAPADGREHIHDAAGIVFIGGFELEAR